MKKFIYSIMAMALMCSLNACSDKDDSKQDDPEIPGQETTDYGVYIVNAGNMYSNIDGSLEYVNLENGEIFSDIFKSANDGATIGDTFNSGMIYGDYIWLAVTDSKVIHVIARENYKLVKTITTSLGGPRQLTVYDGMVYATLFGQPGYLAEINPATMEITRTLELGPLPEYVVPFEEKLYVSVSDGSGDGSQACVAVVDPASFAVTQKITGIYNPVNLATNGSRIYVCAWGQYLSEYPYSQYNYGVYEIKDNKFSDKLCNGTFISINGNNLYYMEAAYGNDTIEYGVIDTQTNQVSKWIDAKDGVDSPIAMGVDPTYGDVFILSYELGEGGYASYSTPGYVKRYKADGSVVGTYSTGVGPTSMFFNVSQ